VTGNIAKWVAELVEFELDFIPRHAVKSQVLADFIVDWTPSASLLGGPDDSEPEPRACPTLGLTTFWNTLGRGNHVNNILVYSVGRFTITKCLVMKMLKIGSPARSKDQDFFPRSRWRSRCGVLWIKVH
jgi:hypothetical protein